MPFKEVLIYPVFQLDGCKILAVPFTERQKYIISLFFSRKELQPVEEVELEINPPDFFPAGVSFPIRPPWDFNMTPAQLDAQEQRYFKVIF